MKASFSLAAAWDMQQVGGFRPSNLHHILRAHNGNFYWLLSHKAMRLVFTKVVRLTRSRKQLKAPTKMNLLCEKRTVLKTLQGHKYTFRNTNSKSHSTQQCNCWVIVTHANTIWTACAQQDVSFIMWQFQPIHMYLCIRLDHWLIRVSLQMSRKITSAGKSYIE